MDPFERGYPRWLLVDRNTGYRPSTNAEVRLMKTLSSEPVESSTDVIVDEVQPLGGSVYGTEGLGNPVTDVVRTHSLQTALGASASKPRDWETICDFSDVFKGTSALVYIDPADSVMYLYMGAAASSTKKTYAQRFLFGTKMLQLAGKVCNAAYLDPSGMGYSLEGLNAYMSTSTESDFAWNTFTSVMMYADKTTEVGDLPAGKLLLLFLECQCL